MVCDLHLSITLLPPTGYPPPTAQGCGEDYAAEPLVRAWPYSYFVNITRGGISTVTPCSGVPGPEDRVQTDTTDSSETESQIGSDGGKGTLPLDAMF